MRPWFWAIWLPLAPLAAHPHVWIDMAVELVIEGNIVRGFWAEWTFDEMMTAMVLTDVPATAGGTFSETGSRRIFQSYFSNLRNYNYFSYVWQDKRSIPVTRVESFQPSVRRGRLVYRFFVPIGRAIPPTGTEIVISMYDETYYTDMGFRRDNPVRVSGVDPPRVRFRLAQNPNRAYFGGMVYPEEAIITIEGSRSR